MDPEYLKRGYAQDQTPEEQQPSPCPVCGNPFRAEWRDELVFAGCAADDCIQLQIGYLREDVAREHWNRLPRRHSGEAGPTTPSDGDRWTFARRCVQAGYYLRTNEDPFATYEYSSATIDAKAAHIAKHDWPRGSSGDCRDADLLKAINHACAIIERGDNRLLASDGPVNGQPPELYLDEWRDLYTTLDRARSNAPRSPHAECNPRCDFRDGWAWHADPCPNHALRVIYRNGERLTPPASPSSETPPELSATAPTGKERPAPYGENSTVPKDAAAPAESSIGETGSPTPPTRKVATPGEWQRKTRLWNEYPEGTEARDHTGASWTKLVGGRWQANGGDAFPTPGADALEVRLPVGAQPLPSPPPAIVSTYHGPVGGDDERGVVVRLCTGGVVEVAPEKGLVARLSRYDAQALAYSLLDFAIRPYAGDIARRAIEATPPTEVKS